MKTTLIAAILILGFNPATVWFELLPSHPCSVLLSRFNPATVWFELDSAEVCVDDWNVSIPQRSDLNANCRRSHPQPRTTFQSRNGLIWTQNSPAGSAVPLLGFNPATVWFERICSVTAGSGYVSFIPQRSDLNIRYADGLHTFKPVSIPQRSDLNNTYRQADPPEMVSIPQRSDLNVVDEIVKAHKYAFQSRNGLIWTQRPQQHAQEYHRFNPATVWFELSANMQSGPIRRVSIPQRSDLNKYNSPEPAFSSAFQSRNGLIWTWCCGVRFRDIEGVSIPQRSDLNNPKNEDHDDDQMFQSRNGLIWTERAMFDVRDPKSFQSRNGLIWTCRHSA